MNAIVRFSLWALDAATAPTLPGDMQAVAALRLGQAAQLPTRERELLLRLMSQPEGGSDPPERTAPWSH